VLRAAVQHTAFLSTFTAEKDSKKVDFCGKSTFLSTYTVIFTSKNVDHHPAGPKSIPTQHPPFRNCTNSDNGGKGAVRKC
jgi:hypothetical protein